MKPGDRVRFNDCDTWVIVAIYEGEIARITIGDNVYAQVPFSKLELVDDETIE